MEQDILSFVRKGLNDRRERPGWLTIAERTGVNYSTIWRIVNEDRDVKLSTVTPLADWIRNDEKKRARA
jgi:predicted transcriptional regulator